MMSKYDLSQFRILFLAGERTDPDTLEWAEKAVQRPVIDHWWQTETGWAIAANCMGLEPLPVKPGSPTKPVPGWDVRVLDETNKEVARGQSGAICVKLPLPRAPCRRCGTTTRASSSRTWPSFRGTT